MTPKMNSLMTTKEAMGINQTAHHELGIVVQDKLQSLSTGFQQLPTPCVVHQSWNSLLLSSGVMFKTTCSCILAILSFCKCVFGHQPSRRILLNCRGR